MNSVLYYRSPVGTLKLSAEDGLLTGLDFLGDCDFTQSSSADGVPECVLSWLNCYFRGNNPDFTPPLLLKGSEFQMVIWKLLSEIPYGQTVTYGEIAKKAAQITGKEKMSAQAVGGAVGRNPIGIIVPCHRVLGAGRRLTGFGGGIDVKIKLLQTEGVCDFRI